MTEQHGLNVTPLIDTTPEILKPSTSFKTTYPWVEEFIALQKSEEWRAEDYHMRGDLQDLKVKLTEPERLMIIETLKLFSKYEIALGTEYWGGMFQDMFPKKEFQQLGSLFSSVENTSHLTFYTQMMDCLGLNTVEFFNSPYEDEVFSKRLKHITKAFSEPDLLKRNAVFTFLEGTTLFSSIAALMSFRAPGSINAMRNMVSGITHSAIEECLVAGTEVLTENGDWIRLEDYKDLSVKVAQFDPETEEVSFVSPSRIVDKEYKGDTYLFDHKQMHQIVTPGHRMLKSTRRLGGHSPYWFQEASEARYHPQSKLPTGGYLSGSCHSLTDLERFYIAVQADGSVSDRYTGEISGTRPIVFSFSKQRKIDRIKSIVDALGFSYKETLEKEPPITSKRKRQTKFIINIPMEFFRSDLKTLDWVDLAGKSSEWCVDFLEEAQNWDGYAIVNKTKENGIGYDTTIKSCADKIQAISALAGYSCSMWVKEDKRSENFNDLYRCYIRRVNYVGGGTISKTKQEYNGRVYCLTVPTGAFLVRSRGKVSVSGNCLHSKASAMCYKQLKEEMNLSEEQKTYYEEYVHWLAEKVVAFEKKLIAKLFQYGPIRSITEEDLGTFIEHRACKCIGYMGYDEPEFTKPNPVADWFYLSFQSYGVNDFFSTTGRHYDNSVDRTRFV